VGVPSGANVIKTFYDRKFMNFRNKLECLSLGNLFKPSLCEGKVRSGPLERRCTEVGSILTRKH